MKRFNKIVAIEPTRFPSEWDEKLHDYAEEVKLYDNIPDGEDEIIKRIENADCVLLSYTSCINGKVLDSCANIKYIGMCCSLYSPESANVDILHAKEKGIVVTGVRDYGDEGVREYVVSELVRLLQGRGGVMWKDEPMELTGLNIGIVGMGTVGSLVAQTLNFFGSNIYYYSRTRKSKLEEEYSYTYLSLDDLLKKVDILITCLNKNVVLFGKREFDLFGSGKIFMNVSISPSHEISALKEWLKDEKNYAFSDSVAGLGEKLTNMNNVFYGNRSSGLTSLAKHRLAQKAIANIENFLNN